MSTRVPRELGVADGQRVAVARKRRRLIRESPGLDRAPAPRRRSAARSRESVRGSAIAGGSRRGRRFDRRRGATSDGARGGEPPLAWAANVVRGASDRGDQSPARTRAVRLSLSSSWMSRRLEHPALPIALGIESGERRHAAADSRQRQRLPSHPAPLSASGGTCRR